jgi:hypothetical protein
MAHGPAAVSREPGTVGDVGREVALSRGRARSGCPWSRPTLSAPRGN